MDTNNPNGIGESLSLDDAAQLIGNIGREEPEEVNQETQSEDDASQEQAQDTEEPEAQETEEPEDAEEAQSEPEAQRYKVKIDGVESEVTAEELIAGYQRQQDYTRKTQELAPLRKEAEERAARLAQTEDVLQEQLIFAYKTAEQFAPQKPDISLAQTDPASYVQQLAYWQQGQEHINQLREQFAQSKARQNEIQAHNKQRMVQENLSKLTEAIPELRSNETREKWVQTVTDGLQKHFGITQAEINQTDDWRMFVIADKAIKYMAMEANKPKIAQKVKQAPASLPTSKRPSKVELKSAAVSESIKKVKQTGSVYDAAEAIGKLLKS